MERHARCSAARRLSAGENNNDTFFTREGTAAHEFAELIAGDEMIDETTWLGGRVDLTAKRNRLLHPAEVGALGDLAPEVDSWDVFEIDEEMIEGAALYRDTILSYLSPGDQWGLERRIDLNHIAAGMFGTSDAFVWKRKKRKLIIFDFKYGSGYAVEVEENEQLMTYVLGIWKMLGYPTVIEFECVIIQPRAFHRGGPVRRFVFDAAVLSDFERHLREVIRKTENPALPATPGDHCVFCPAAYKCTALRDFVYEVTGATIDPDGEAYETDMPKIAKMSADDLGRVVRAAKIIDIWKRRVMERAHEEAMAGRIPTGTKLVEKRAYRSWENAEDTIRALDQLGYDEGEYMSEPELLSPAKVEKALGKKRFSKLSSLVRKRSTGYVLADINDARPAVEIDKSSSFGEVTDDDY